MSLSNYKVLTFDCYGTLIDWERGLVNALQVAGYNTKGREGELLNLFAKHESPVQKEFPDLAYPHVLEKTLERMTNEKDLDNGFLGAQTLVKFRFSIADWPAFADSAEALAYLKQHYKLVVISNIDKDSFEESEKKLGVKFDAVVTAQDVQSYKPAAKHFTHALDLIQKQFGASKDQVLHVFQSMYHDAVPATELGIATCHIKRAPLASCGTATPSVAAPPKCTFEFATLAELVAARKAEGQ